VSTLPWFAVQDPALRTLLAVQQARSAPLEAALTAACAEEAGLEPLLRALCGESLHQALQSGDWARYEQALVVHARRSIDLGEGPERLTPVEAWTDELVRQLVDALHPSPGELTAALQAAHRLVGRATALWSETCRRAREEERACPRPQVLVVEADTQARARLQQGLEEGGCRVHVASSGAQALVLCQRQSYQAVTLALHLPDRTGLSLLEALLEKPAFRKIPVLLYDTASRPLEPQSLLQALRQAAILPSQTPSDDASCATPSGGPARLYTAGAEVWVLSPPRPEELESLRRRWVVLRFARTATALGLVLVLYANLAVGLWAANTHRLSLVAGAVIMGLLSAPPVLALGGWLWAGQKRGRTVLRAVRRALGIEERPRWQSWSSSLLAALGALLLTAALWESAQSRSVSFLLVGALLPLAGSTLDPAWPWRARVLVGAWNALGAWGAALLWSHIGPGLALLGSVLWMAGSPFLWPTLLLRGHLLRLVGRQDGVGQLARAWAVFLPPAQQARVRRGRGDWEGALRILRQALSRPLRGPLLQEVLLETGELLLELGDSRATGLFASAVWLRPTETGPLHGLAKALRQKAPELARAYTSFAEQNAARALVPRRASATLSER
jgi:CheY-like chemotaxis protein